MSIGISGASTPATWPKSRRHKKSHTVEHPGLLPRPSTATLERPTILDISLLGKIDMSLTTKGLLSISNLCISSIDLDSSKVNVKNTKNAGFVKKIDRGRTKYGRRKYLTDVESGTESSTSAVETPTPEPHRLFKGAKNLKVSPRKQPRENTKAISNKSASDLNNNNKATEKESKEKNISQTVLTKKRSKKINKKSADEVFSGPKSKVEVPEPCRTCGRPEQPERFHSHPKPASAVKLNNNPTSVSVIASEPVNRKTVKSSVRKPVAINYRSSEKTNRKTQDKGVISNTEESKEDKNQAVVVMSEEKEKTRQGPKTILCYLCGREFGKASYPLHEPHCLQRWQRENSLLPSSLQRQIPEKPDKDMNLEEWNKFAWEAIQSQLVPCENCGRTFNPDRLEVHQRSCRSSNKNPNQQKPTEPKDDTTMFTGRGPPAIYCYICGRMFGTKSIDIHEPQCLEKWRSENEKLPKDQRRPEPIKQGPNTDVVAQPPPPPPVRTPAPDSAPSSAYKPPKRKVIHCYLCGREFGTASINIHEPQCLKKWTIENNKLPLNQRRTLPEKPNFRFTDSGNIDFEGTMDAMWQSHLSQLVPCSLGCGRTFFPDRVAVHERGCKGKKN